MMTIIGIILCGICFLVCFGICLYGQEEQDELAEEYIRMVEKRKNQK